MAALDGSGMIRWAITGLASLLAGYVFMYAGGMCSHIAAFKILYGLRVKLSDHIGRLPLGFFDKNKSIRPDYFFVSAFLRQDDRVPGFFPPLYR
jgi:ABC-type multidrug transport system fused ATPase/permease subunit